MGKVWVENKASGPRVIGGVLLQPGEGAFVEDGGAQEVSTPSVPLLVNPVTGQFSDARMQSLVSGDWKRKGIASAAVLQRGVLGQFPDGSYLAYDEWPGAGEGSARLARIVGDPLAGGVATALPQTSALAANALLNAAGAVVGASPNSITQAWIASNGDVFFVMVATGNVHFLYRAKAGTYTVGSDGAYTNKRACIDLGLYGGTQADQVRGFNRRALLDATVNGVRQLYFCEYNVTAGRTPGAGGAGKDQVIVYRSLDGGTTWAVFLEFNTGGTHVLDHFHGATQDPYTGWIYFMTGDNGAENAVLAYNGTAAAPAANTSLATLGATAGWKVISGSELHRYTDLCFDKDGIFSIPDADTESADTGSVAFVATRLPRTLDYVVSVAAVERMNDIPPYQALQDKDAYGALMVSFRTESANTASEPYLWIWSANVEDGTWTLIAKVRNHRNLTGVPKAAFVDTQGRLWIAAAYKGGINFSAALSASATTSSVCLTLGDRTAAPLIYDAA